MFAEERVASGLVLWIYDCGARGEREGSCRPEQRGFTGPTRTYQGDARTLEARLIAAAKAGGYAEIRLWSGGGSLLEGLNMGAVLNKHQATVRVVRDAVCASSCTIAFLGGAFRFVDRGARFQVHAYSRWLEGFGDDESLSQRNRLLSDPEGELRRYAHDEYRIARELAAHMLVHFQRAVLPLGADPARAVDLDGWKAEPPTIPYSTRPAVPSSNEVPSIPSDARRIRNERAPAAQDILMRIEREAMEQAIADLRSLLPRLGARAEHALRMLEAMFSSSTTRTADLSEETLASMGYVTRMVWP
jgi:hypothetical protein